MRARPLAAPAPSSARAALSRFVRALTVDSRMPQLRGHRFPPRLDVRAADGEDDRRRAADGEASAEWLEGVRESISAAGKYLAMFADGRSRVIELSDGWSRIGRSRSADIRLDDPTVSRRHAVIVKTPEGDLRVLDDRSMNGVCVNGESVDWSPRGRGRATGRPLHAARDRVSGPVAAASTEPEEPRAHPQAPRRPERTRRSTRSRAPGRRMSAERRRGAAAGGGFERRRPRRRSG